VDGGVARPHSTKAQRKPISSACSRLGILHSSRHTVRPTYTSLFLHMSMRLLEVLSVLTTMPRRVLSRLGHAHAPHLHSAGYHSNTSSIYTRLGTRAVLQYAKWFGYLDRLVLQLAVPEHTLMHPTAGPFLAPRDPHCSPPA
jgi:hypothetical protein